MPSFFHKKIIDRIKYIDALPTDIKVLSEWVKAGDHIKLLYESAKVDEIVIYASGPFTFIHSIAVPNDALQKFENDDLLKWSCNPYTSYASYVSSNEGMEINRGIGWRGCDALDEGMDLIFGRTFEGWSGEGRDYFEASQEYTHLTGIHWRPEYNAYCKFDHNGDLAQTISITVGKGQDISLVTFTWPELEEYLAISDSSLVRMFDFTLLNHSNFSGWPDTAENKIELSEDFFYRQKTYGTMGYTRGIQIIRPRVTAEFAHKNVRDSWSGKKDKQYAEFIAHDWRNGCVTKISTDPKATANYFNAEGNDKPFELSPAFFRPEVLSKYKTDRDKYTIAERSISCRSAWHLKGYDLNEAGQIHAYICDLRSLPYSEQLHWLSYNEEPKAGISHRAVVNDFEGTFVDFSHPREEVISIARRWRERPIPWWTLRDEELLNRANIPLTTSTDEWANAFLDLSKLIVEGFEVKAIRKRLDDAAIQYDSKEQSVLLLERLLSGVSHPSMPARLEGLRTIQMIRSKVAGHSGGSAARTIANDAITEYGSYNEHFTHACRLAAQELEAVAQAFEAIG